MKQNYQLNDRVEYYVVRHKQRVHRIGYIKAYRKFLFWGKYYVYCSRGTHEIDIVRASQIFGKVEPIKKNNYDN